MLLIGSNNAAARLKTINNIFIFQSVDFVEEEYKTINYYRTAEQVVTTG